MRRVCSWRGSGRGGALNIVPSSRANSPTGSPIISGPRRAVVVAGSDGGGQKKSRLVYGRQVHLWEDTQSNHIPETGPIPKRGIDAKLRLFALHTHSICAGAPESGLLHRGNGLSRSAASIRHFSDPVWAGTGHRNSTCICARPRRDRSNSGPDRRRPTICSTLE